MKSRGLFGALTALVALFALSVVTVSSVPSAEEKTPKSEKKKKKTKDKKGTKDKSVKAKASPMEALKAMVDFSVATASADPSERIVQTIETPFTSAYKVVHLEFRNAEACENFKVDGTSVFARFGRFADVFVDPSKPLMDVLFKNGNPGIVWFDVATVAVAPPPRPIQKDTERARAVGDAVRNGVGDINGKGVIVVVVDTGLDFHHPDFINYDADGKATSRLLYFWDTSSDGYVEGAGSKAPISFPNGASVGTVYSRADITAELRGGKPRIHVWDISGHGTGCASIAAGNGNAVDGKRYAGVAPQADIIGVRIQDQGPGLENAYLLNAICAWVDEVAAKEGKPAVITCSFGGQTGGRDGYLVDERHLSARFADSVKGRAICIAAGNEGYSRIHAAVNAGPDEKGTLKWVSFRGGIVDIYTDATNKADVQIECEQAKQSVQYVHGLTGNVVVQVVVPSGRGELRLVSKSGKKIQADAYISSSGDPQDGFDDSCRVVAKQVGTPANAAQAITVGSYDFDNQFELQGKPLFFKAPNSRGQLDNMRVGALSAYSNPGPSRLTNVVKPDLVAPGQWWTAAAALNAQARVRDTSGKYRIFNGTSAATPYTAGVLALVMQKKPTITVGEIKELIRNHADKDDEQVNQAGKAPNPAWGHGKLNRKAVMAMLEAVR